LGLSCAGSLSCRVRGRGACVPVQRARTLLFGVCQFVAIVFHRGLCSYVFRLAFDITTATVTSRYLKTRETTRPHDAPARSSTVPRMSSKPTLRRAPCSMGGGPMIGSQPLHLSRQGHASHSHALRIWPSPGPGPSPLDPIRPPHGTAPYTAPHTHDPTRSHTAARAQGEGLPVLLQGIWGGGSSCCCVRRGAAAAAAYRGKACPATKTPSEKN
jgi:hypothetical protein